MSDFVGNNLGFIEDAISDEIFKHAFSLFLQRFRKLCFVIILGDILMLSSGTSLKTAVGNSYQ